MSSSKNCLFIKGKIYAKSDCLLKVIRSIIFIKGLSYYNNGLLLNLVGLKKKILIPKESVLTR